MKRIMVMLAMLMFSPMLVQAEVTLNLSAGQFYRNDGSAYDWGEDPLTLTLLADTAGDGFGNLTNSLTTFGTDQADDKIIRYFGSNDWLGFPGSTTNDIQFSYGDKGVEAGNPLLLVWYDTAFNESLDPMVNGPALNTHFGKYRNDLELDGGISWFLPADGATNALNFQTLSTGGSLAESYGIADCTVTPEPVSSVLMLIGAGILGFRRRFMA